MLCYKRHTSLLVRWFCHSYKLDVCWYGLQTASIALKPNQGRKQTSLSWEAATDDYLSKHSRAAAADMLCSLATAVGFTNGLGECIREHFFSYKLQYMIFFIAWKGLLRIVWDTVIFVGWQWFLMKYCGFSTI